MLTKKQIAARVRHVRKWRRASRQANETLDLARAYLMDGALLSAADHYRKAAALIEQAHAARNAWLEKQ